jgi:hypothetical protein
LEAALAGAGAFAAILGTTFEAEEGSLELPTLLSSAEDFVLF